MRIPMWPGVRLTVWERQNPEAVKVTLAFAKPYPVRRVLSMRGWILLLVRYDWRTRGQSVSDDLAKSPVVQALTKELHRRSTHFQTMRNAPEGEVPTDRWAQISGEVIGLRGALGIALGGRVEGGTADELAHTHYQAWMAANASEWSRCRCPRCTGVLTNGGAR